MSQEFFIVAFNTLDGIDLAALRAAFNKGLAWTQCVGNTWIIKTSSDVNRWYGRLEPLIGDDHTFFICKIDPYERQGWMEQRVWNWLTENVPKPPTPNVFGALLNPPKKDS